VGVGRTAAAWVNLFGGVFVAGSAADTRGMENPRGCNSEGKASRCTCSAEGGRCIAPGEKKESAPAKKIALKIRP